MNESELGVTIVLVTLLLVILLAGIFIAYISIGRQKNKQLMALTQAQLKFEQELRMVEVELAEQMMGRFSRELHDNVGHELTCIRLAIENIKLDNATLNELLMPIDQYLTEASDQLQLLSRSFNSDYISQLNLKEAMNLEVKRLEQLKKFEICWESDFIKSPLNKNQELIVFRIFQEVVSNMAKHSKATRLTIELKSNEKLILTIADNGRGFNLNEMLESKDASGLRNILKRSEIAGIDCDIKTAIGYGCKYTLQYSDSKQLTEYER